MKLFPFQRFTVHGNSMLPILKPGQDVLVWCWFYTAKSGDIVVIKKNGKEMVKRVQKVLDQTWAHRPREVIVQGDNKKMSIDSRDFGSISQKDIVGKVVLMR